MADYRDKEDSDHQFDIEAVIDFDTFQAFEDSQASMELANNKFLRIQHQLDRLKLKLATAATGVRQSLYELNERATRKGK